MKVKTMKMKKVFTISMLTTLFSTITLALPHWMVQASNQPNLSQMTQYHSDQQLIPARQFKGNVIEVTTTADVLAVDNQCSLREAIISANSNPVLGPVGECAFGKNNQTDVIVLAEGATYPLMLDGLDFTAQVGDLDISDDPVSLDVRIVVANNGTATIDAKAINDRIFQIFDAHVSMTGVTLRNGSADVGGAIVSNGVVTLTNSSVISNHATSTGGGISSGALTLINSTVISNVAEGDGGGIYVDDTNAPVLLKQSQLVGNKSANGGNGAGMYIKDTITTTIRCDLNVTIMMSTI